MVPVCFRRDCHRLWSCLARERQGGRAFWSANCAQPDADGAQPMCSTSRHHFSLGKWSAVVLGVYAGARAHAVGVHVHHAEHERRSNAAFTPHCRDGFRAVGRISDAGWLYPRRPRRNPYRYFGHAVRSCRARVRVVVVGICLRRSSGIAQLAVVGSVIESESSCSNVGWVLSRSDTVRLVDVRIGVTQTARELAFEVDDDQRDDLHSRVDAALGGTTDVLWVTDRKGREVAIPAAKIAYVELGTSEERRIGFGG